MKNKINFKAKTQAKTQVKAQAFRLVLVVFSLLVLSSCSSKKQKLDIYVPELTTNIIKNLSYKSCSDIHENVDSYSVSANAFYLNYFKVKWKEEGKPLSITSISLELRSTNISGGAYEKYLDDDEIHSLFSDPSNGDSDDEYVGERTVAYISTDATPGEVRTTSGCRVLFGGIAFVDSSRVTNVTGTLTITGVYEDDDNLIPVKASTSVSGLYNP